MLTDMNEFEERPRTAEDDAPNSITALACLFFFGLIVLASIATAIGLLGFAIQFMLKAIGR